MFRAYHWYTTFLPWNVPKKHDALCVTTATMKMRALFLPRRFTLGYEDYHAWEEASRRA